VINKIKTHAHLEVKNYRTPLEEKEDKEEEQQLDSIHKTEETTIKKNQGIGQGGDKDQQPQRKKA
jgi:hypothetical protein